jgi:ACS family pantothenate transporter-like MFS transporter
MAEKAPSVVAVVSSTPSSRWKGWLWDSADVSKEERRFLLKVGGLAILSIIIEDSLF